LQAHGDLDSRLGKEQQVSAESARQVKELQEQLSQRAADLQSAREELDQQAKGHGRAESDLRRELQAAGAAAKQNEATYKQAQARCGHLEQELAGLRQARE